MLTWIVLDGGKEFTGEKLAPMTSLLLTLYDHVPGIGFPPLVTYTVAALIVVKSTGLENWSRM